MIHIIGIPLPAWNPDFFYSIVKDIGTITEIDPLTLSQEFLDYVKIKVFLFEEIYFPC